MISMTKTISGMKEHFRNEMKIQIIINIHKKSSNLNEDDDGGVCGCDDGT
jgi:hypothetical protein